MKKWMMLLCCVLALNLAACGAKEEGAADRVGAQGALHFEVATRSMKTNTRPTTARC